MNIDQLDTSVTIVDLDQLEVNINIAPTYN